MLSEQPLFFKDLCRARWTLTERNGKQKLTHYSGELQDIERCFRTLKSSLDIRPMYHRADRRIQAHILMCVMALQLHRFIRSRLNASKIVKSPDRVLEKLSFQRTVEAQVNGQTIKGLTASTSEQLTFYDALGVARPQYQDINTV